MRRVYRAFVFFTSAWLVLAVLTVPWSSPVLAQAPVAWTFQDEAGATRVHLYFFWSETCPHCQDARPHVRALAEQHPWIRLHDLELSRHPDHVQTYLNLAASLGRDAQSVPAFIFCGRMEVGWDSAQTTGQALLAALESCRDPSTPQPDVARPASLILPLIGAVNPDHLSLPALTLLIAGMDAFNPCAFFVLLFLLSLLTHQRDRHRMLLIGSVFVLVSGLMYFAFMAAWLNLFKFMGGLAWITAAAGALALVIGIINVKDFFAFKKGLSLSIPESRKADIFRRGRAILAAGNLPAMLAATVLLAVAANVYELLCTAGFPMVYTRILTLHTGGTGQHYLYLALYNAVYVLPLLIIVLAFVASLGARRLTERQGRLLKLMSGVMMGGLGLLLLLAPERLNQLGIAFALMAGAVAVTALAARLTREPPGP